MKKVENCCECLVCRSGRKEYRWRRKALSYANNGASIQLEFEIDVQFVVDLEVIFGVLDFAGFVFANWLLKEKSQALPSLPGSRVEKKSYEYD